VDVTHPVVDVVEPGSGARGAKEHPPPAPTGTMEFHDPDLRPVVWFL
jgi:hypothetical protein